MVEDFNQRNIVSTKLNNQILLSKFNISEDKNSIFFHKKSNDNNYYILIKSSPIELEDDPKTISIMKNEKAKQMNERVIMDKGFEKSLGLEHNPEYIKAMKEPLYSPEPEMQECDFDV